MDFKIKPLYFDELDSTNTYAKGLLNSCPADELKALNGTLIIAGKQTAGRGRLGRTFYSPENTGLYISLIYVPSSPITNPALTTASAGVAVCRALERNFPVKTGIKWVNDVYIAGKKVAGILTEGVVGRGANETLVNTPPSLTQISSAVIGIGVNLTTQNFPDDLRIKAGSVLGDSGVANEALISNVGAGFETKVSVGNSGAGVANETLINNSGAELRTNLALEISTEIFSLLENPVLSIKEYRERSILIGKTVLVCPVIDKTERQFTATVLDITDEAKLKVQSEPGEVFYLDSGEVSLKI